MAVAPTRSWRNPIDRMTEGYDPHLFVLDNGRAYSTARTSPQSMANLGYEQERQRREAEQTRDWENGIWMQRAQNVLPGMTGFGGFFGMLQGRENAARVQGKRMNVDLVGQGPGTGFGRWKANVDGGVGYSLEDQQGQSDLAAAAERAEAHREDQARRAVHKEPYVGPFSRQGAGTAVDEMLAEGTEGKTAKTASTGAKRKAPTRIARPTGPKKVGGSYQTTPR